MTNKPTCIESILEQVLQLLICYMYKKYYVLPMFLTSVNSILQHKMLQNINNCKQKIEKQTHVKYVTVIREYLNE